MAGSFVSTIFYFFHASRVRGCCFSATACVRVRSRLCTCSFQIIDRIHRATRPTGSTPELGSCARYSSVGLRVFSCVPCSTGSVCSDPLLFHFVQEVLGKSRCALSGCVWWWRHSAFSPSGTDPACSHVAAPLDSKYSVLLNFPQHFPADVNLDETAGSWRHEFLEVCATSDSPQSGPFAVYSTKNPQSTTFASCSDPNCRIYDI